MKFNLLEILQFLWLLNLGTFTFKGRTYLFMRVAKHMQACDGFLPSLVFDSDHESNTRVHYGLSLSKKYCAGGKMMVT